jgi:hypothetical protein
MRVTDRLEIDANFAWAKGKVSGPLPCNDGNFDGKPDNNIPANYGALLAAMHVGFATCNINPGTSTSPPWTLRMTAEYDQPINPNIEGFVRGLFQYQPENPNADPVYTQPAFGMLDLWLGIHVHDPSIEVAFYGKNITGTREILNDLTASDIGATYLRSSFGTSGYKAVTLTPRREFGITALFAFGSH